MTQIVQYGSTFNLANVFVPDVYLEVVPPQSYFGGAPTSVAAMTGTASWGKLNTPIALSDPSGILSAFGGITAAALTDPHDLCTDLSQALNQAQGSAGLIEYGVRVSDGTDAPATIALVDQSGTPQVGGTLTATCSGVAGDQIFANVQPSGNATNTLNVTIVPFSGGGNAELFTGFPNNGTTFWAALQNAINNGQGPSRPRSKFVTMSGATTTSLAPKINNYQLSGGSDGRSVTTAQLIGSPYTSISLTPEVLTLSGTLTTNDVINLLFINQGLPQGQHNLQYAVTGGDTTLTLLATSIKNAINADGTLTGLGFNATSSGPAVSITWPGNIGAVAFSTNSNGTTTATVGGTITAGDVLTLTIHDAGLQNGSKTAIYTVQGGDTTTTVATALKNAINALTGVNAAGITASSVAAVITIVSVSVNATTYSKSINGGATETLTLAGGPTESGVLSGGPTPVGAPSGIYTLANTQFKASVLWCTGLTDTAGASTILAFGKTNNIFTLFSFASGTDVPTAVSSKQSMGIFDYQMGMIKDWVYIFDTVNNQTRLIAPYATAGGKMATLAPWISPLNQAVNSIIGTERNNPITGTSPYSFAELTSLGQAGIMVLSNPVPGGQFFGFRNGYNSVGNNQATSYVEYSRTTNFFANSLGTILGPFIGQNQSQQPNDPWRANVKTAVNAFFQPIKTGGFIDAFVAIVGQPNNPLLQSIQVAQHIGAVNVLVTYLASVQVCFTQLQGGTTVQVTVNQPGQSLVGT